MINQSNPPSIDQIALDALSALFISSDIDSTSLLYDIHFAEYTELPQIADAMIESIHIAHDHAMRLILALRSNETLLQNLAESLEICPIHLCDPEICE